LEVSFLKLNFITPTAICCSWKFYQNVKRCSIFTAA
jgi:hypothetical protein